MPRFLLPLVLLLLVSSAQALDVDQLVQKNIEARGGLEALRAMGSLKTTGRLNFSQGDFSMELGYVSLLRRDARLRLGASPAPASAHRTGGGSGGGGLCCRDHGKRSSARAPN